MSHLAVGISGVFVDQLIPGRPCIAYVVSFFAASAFPDVAPATEEIRHCILHMDVIGPLRQLSAGYLGIHGLALPRKPA